MISLPYYTPGSHLTFLGFEMQQNRFAPLAFSHLICTEDPARIIEIGTWKGGFTCLLGIAARHCSRCHVISFDNDPREPWNSNGDWFDKFAITHRREDVLLPDTVTEIRKLIQDDGQSVVLCDGGNKIKEFDTFAPFLKAGDAIAAHDYSVDGMFWGTNEITPADVAQSIMRQGLKSYKMSMMHEAGWFCYRKEKQ